MRFFNLRRLALKRLDLHACAVSQFLQGILKIQPFALHHELENIPALVTLTKTAPCSGLRPYHKSRRMLVVMERTESRIVLACMAQLYASLRHEVYDIYLGFNVINGCHGNQFVRSHIGMSAGFIIDLYWTGCKLNIQLGLILRSQSGYQGIQRQIEQGKQIEKISQYPSADQSGRNINIDDAKKSIKIHCCILRHAQAA